MRDEELELLLEKLHYLTQGAELVVFAGSLPRDVADDFYAEAARDLTRRHVPVVLDSEGEPLRLGVEAEPFLVSPNQSEAEALVGQEFHDEEDFRLALDSIAEMGARNVLITTEDGCVALLREEREIRRLRARRAAGRAALDRRLGRRAARRLPGSAPRRPLRRGVAACRGRRGRRVDARGRRRPLRPAARGPLAGRRRGQRARARPEPGLTLIRRPRYPLPMDVGKLAFDPSGTALPEKFAKEGLTFDDVLLVPAESSVLPNDVSTATRLTRTIVLEVPIVSAAMDTVTEARLAIALAREGGLGIVHRNLSIAAQVGEVDKVKRSEAGMIVEPVTLPPDALVSDAVDLMERYHISGVPITSADGPARRHPHEPRPALRAQPRAARLRADDLATASSPRRSARRCAKPSSCCTGIASRSCRSSTPTGASRA